MSAELRVKYFFFDFSYAAYIRLQITILISLMAAAVLFFVFARSSEIWLLRSGWWISLIAFVGELVETRLGLSRARKESAIQDSQ